MQGRRIVFSNACRQIAVLWAQLLYNTHVQCLHAHSREAQALTLDCELQWTIACLADIRVYLG